MKTKLALILVGTIAVTSSMLGGCPPQELSAPLPAPVSYDGATLRVPGSTILYQGQEYQGEAPISGNALAAVLKDGEAFLYHPALGSADLSAETSRRAVGYFLTYRMSASAEARLKDSASLNIGETTSLSTGIDVRRLGSATYEATNKRVRWAVVKSGTGADPLFLPPDAGIFEGDLLGFIADAIDALLNGGFAPTSQGQIEVGESEVETYGAMTRALPLFNWPIVGPQLRGKAAVAIDRDAALFLRVNALDYMLCAIEGVQSILGLFPLECADAAVNGVVLNTFEIFGVGLLTDDPELTGEFAEAMAVDLSQSLAGCACVAATGGACEAVTTFLDILAALDWIIDDTIVGAIDVVRSDAFAAAEGIDDCPNDPYKTAPGTCGCGTPDSNYRTWYLDADGDGAGDPSDTRQSCSRPSGYVPNSNDKCPSDPNKTSTGDCGCGQPEVPGCGVQEQVATPTFDPDGGTFTDFVNITISCATLGATIRYTTEGTDPDESSTQYTAPIPLAETTTLKARGFKDGWDDSAVVSATFTVASVGKIYWAEGAGIMRADLNGSDVELLVGASAYAIAVDQIGGKVYWSHSQLGDDEIQRANLDGSNLETVVAYQGGSLGIAVDGENAKVYWTNRFADKIQRCNLDGSDMEDLVTTGLTDPRGIDLDVQGGKMYWVDTTADKIQRANLDGSNVEDLVIGLTSPNGIALDVAAGQVYWTDPGADKIQRCNLDGSDMEDLVTTGLTDPRGIDLDVQGGKMYWAVHYFDRIRRANLNGTNVEDLIASGLDSPGGVAIVR